MRIAYNPKTAAALTAAPSNDDITFDLKGIAIYVKGVKFKGTDTTYSVFKKHTSDNKGGYNGLVPVPSYTTTTTRYLREDGTWVVPTNTTYSVFTGATSSTDGTLGLVPKPTSGNQGKFLKADGTWATPTNTTYGVVSSSANGLAPKVINTNTATVGNAYYVLASTNGSASPSWYKLPTNAFANDDTKVTQTNTTGSNNYRVLFSGNANDTTETTTARKSAKLLFNPSVGTLTADEFLGTFTTKRSSDMSAMWAPDCAMAWFTNINHDNKYAGDNTGFPCSSNANGLLWLGTHAASTDPYENLGHGHQLGFSSNGCIYHRNFYSTVPTTANGGSWKQIAYTTSDITGNAATADKLKTKRKLWGLDFDGSADVSGNMTGVGTINTICNIQQAASGVAIFNIVETSADVNYTHLYVTSGNTTATKTRPLVLQNGYGNVGIGVMAPTQKLEVDGNVKATSFIGNIDWSYITNKPTSYTPAAHTHNLLTWSGDVRSTATTPSDYKKTFKFVGIKEPTAVGLTTTIAGSYVSLFGWKGYPNNSGPKSWELASDNKDRIHVRSGAGIQSNGSGNENWSNWNTLAYITDNFPSNQINTLTGYTKATEASSIAATDSLNTALGKLEYKADVACDWITSVTATDTDEYINKWSEIVGFLDSVKEGTDILDEFVTRKTDLTITGIKTFSKVINITNSGGSWVSGMTNAAIKYDSLNALNTNKYHPIIGVKTNAENVVNFGAYINDVGFYGYKKGRTENSYDWLFKFNSETGAITHTGTSITANKYIGTLNSTLTFSAGTFSAKTYNNSAAVTVYIPTHTSHLTNNSGFLTQHQSLDNYVTLNGTQTITGVKTFSTQQKFTVAQGTSPFTVTSTTKVSNLNSDLLDGYDSSRFLRAKDWVANPGLDADTLELNMMCFTYSNNAPHTGTIIYFAGATGGNYGLLLNASYSNSGYLSFRSRNGDSGTWKDWSTILTLHNYTGYVNTTNFPGLNKVGTVTQVIAGTGISVSATTANQSTYTVTNAGVRATTINGNYLRVNTNGTNADLTIPYATRASIAGDGTMNMIPQYNNEINFGGTNASTTLYFGYRATDLKPIPTQFIFGGSDGSASIKASGFIKKGSSDSYVLLGGGGHKALADFLLESEFEEKELTSNIKSISKSLKVTAAWMDTGIKYTDLPANGSYIVQVSAHNSKDDIYYCYWSGIMTWYKDGTNDSDADEILLHRAGHAYGHTIYLRTIMTANSDGRHLRLQIAADTDLSTAVTYTFKFKRII